MRAKDPEASLFLRSFVYDRENGTLTKVGGTAFKPANCHGYDYVWFASRFTACHRIAWLLVTGAWPANDIDHKDGNRRNNCWNNLREATRQQNCENRPAHRNNKLGVRGVRFRARDGFYEPRIMRDGVAVYLGIYKELELAVLARQHAEQELFTHAR